MQFMILTSRASRLRGLLILVLSIGTGVGLACGDTPATQPNTDDPPVAAAMAPSYIAVGKDLSLRLALVRRTLDDLTLDPPTRTQANDLLQACEKEVDGLIKQMENGPMPSSRKVLGIPVYLRTQRNQLYQIIGAEQSQALDEMLRSLRGEGRSTLAAEDERMRHGYLDGGAEGRSPPSNRSTGRSIQCRKAKPGRDFKFRARQIIRNSIRR
jgi:hypothetical protein